MIMACQPETFDVSGPLHLLTSFDWKNTFHRRSLAASLVQGVYSLERDRQGGTSIEHKHEAHASPWWKRFNFQLNHVLEDDSDSSYFGAIYELRYFADPCVHESSPSPPRYVIAFRGTMITNATRFEDCILNLKCVLAKLEKSSRFHTAFEAVRKTVETAGPAKVWLAGHSLGASIAMLVGRNMAKSRIYLETYLFNPPYISIPIERMIKNETLKHGVRIAGSLMKAGIATALKIHHEDPEEDMFTALSEWTPNVFVNPADLICAEYIGYFRHREMMDEMGMGKYAKHSVTSLVSGAIGRDSEPSYIVPTAYLTVNLSPSEGIRQAHGIVQWWQPHFQWQSKLYKFKTL